MEVLKHKYKVLTLVKLFFEWLFDANNRKPYSFKNYASAKKSVVIRKKHGTEYYDNMLVREFKEYKI